MFPLNLKAILRYVSSLSQIHDSSWEPTLSAVKEVLASGLIGSSSSVGGQSFAGTVCHEYVSRNLKEHVPMHMPGIFQRLTGYSLVSLIQVTWQLKLAQMSSCQLWLSWRLCTQILQREQLHQCSHRDS